MDCHRGQLDFTDAMTVMVRVEDEELQQVTSSWQPPSVRQRYTSREPTDKTLLSLTFCFPEIVSVKIQTVNRRSAKVFSAVGE